MKSTRTRSGFDRGAGGAAKRRRRSCDDRFGRDKSSPAFPVNYRRFTKFNLITVNQLKYRNVITLRIISYDPLKRLEAEPFQASESGMSSK